MIDYYYLYDSEETPSYPDENRHLMSFSLEDLSLINSVLRKAEGWEWQLDYYSDTRFSSEEAQAMQTVLQDVVANSYGRAYERPCSAFLQLLKMACVHRAGVMAFCD